MNGYLSLSGELASSLEDYRKTDVYGREKSRKEIQGLWSSLALVFVLLNFYAWV